MDLNALIDKAAEAILSARNVVVFTGAGISKESGIDTFRDPSGNGGWWANKIGLALFGTPIGWKWLPFGVSWNAYRVFMRPIVNAEPNAGHYALAELESFLKDNTHRGDDDDDGDEVNYTIMTQNVDGLHQRAGSTDVLELHGTVTRHVCVRNGHRADPELTKEQIFQSKPRCSVCRSYMRPDAVLFTESLPEDVWRAAERAVSQLRFSSRNVCLVIGTSGLVYPAASIPQEAAKRGNTTIIEVNPVKSTYTENGLTDIFLQGPSGEVLPLLVERVKQLAQGSHQHNVESSKDSTSDT